MIIVKQMENKNIDKIFAGGSHSWVVLNTMQPIRQFVREQSPQYPEQISRFDRDASKSPHRAEQTNAHIDSGIMAYPKKKLSDMSPFQARQTNSTANITPIRPASSGYQQQPQMQAQPPPAGDEFIQKVLEIQTQQLLKSQYFLQVTYCFETDFCHRFVNFEIHDNFVAQFENNVLEEFIQSAYQQEKGALLYHKVQEVPLELLERSKRANKPNLTPGEILFKEVMNDEDLFTEWDDTKKKFKAYTLCMIFNPATAGYDQTFTQWKSSSRSGSEKTKKIVVNSNSYQNAKGGQERDENQMPLIGKIVFLKDTDIEHNEFEDGICKWVATFHRKLGKYSQNTG